MRLSIIHKQVTPAVSSYRPASRIVVHAKKRSGPLGFVEEDNSGKSNIFGVEPKTLYTSSPRSDAAASQGLGGSQGVIVLGVVMALVALVTVGVAKTDNNSSPGAPVDSLTAIARRLS